MNTFPSQFLSDNRKPVVSPWAMLRLNHVESSAIQNRKWAWLFAMAVALALCVARAEAQQPEKVYRIGFLKVSAPPAPYLEALRQGLKKLGYTEGDNIVFEFRWAQHTDQLSVLAAELVRLNVDFIVTDGVAATLPAKR